jgi:crotonobetainyl-CoA:carnitine CoA-transferase CaiB-like acyl-CoA transferase
MSASNIALRQILDCADRPLDTSDEIALPGADPVLPTTFLIGAAGVAALGAVGLAASDLWKLRTGKGQGVSVPLRTAAIAMRSERYLKIGDGPLRDLWNPISGFYQAGDGRWLQLHCNFPHHRAGVLKLLDCPEERTAVEAKIAQWRGEELETALAEAQMCAGMVRSNEEWAVHEQGKAVAALPLFEITRIGDSPPEPLPDGDRPLAGIRALELTRIIAGPVCGKTLAGHGATVMRIAGPHLPFDELLVTDTGMGKLSAHLDLRETADRDKLMTLVKQADVFSQGYRPGAIAGHGFTPEALAKARPGIVCVDLCSYSHKGPWRARRGYDSLNQTVSGIAHEGGGGEKPVHLPAQALDHISGFLGAFGAMIALARRAREGGSWHVRVSLAQTGHWIKSLGRLDADIDGYATPDPGFDDIRDLTMERDSAFGHLVHVVPPITMSETPMRWDRPPVPLGTDAPAWPE